MDDNNKPSVVNRWVRFNDSSVQEVQEGWLGIAKECVEGRSFPTVLVYDRFDGQPVDEAADMDKCAPDRDTLINLMDMAEESD